MKSSQESGKKKNFFLLRMISNKRFNQAMFSSGESVTSMLQALNTARFGHRSTINLRSRRLLSELLNHGKFAARVFDARGKLCVKSLQQEFDKYGAVYVINTGEKKRGRGEEEEREEEKRREKRRTERTREGERE